MSFGFFLKGPKVVEETTTATTKMIKGKLNSQSLPTRHWFIGLGYNIGESFDFQFNVQY